jgi:hypothetical protein
LALGEPALARRRVMVRLCDALNTATLVGHPAPVVEQMRQRIETPQPGDLVMERSCLRGGDRVVYGFGILLCRRQEPLPIEPARDGPVELSAPQTEDVWYVQYGASAGDVCRWTNCSFTAIPVALSE